MPAGQIVDLLEQAVANCGRHVPRSEIVEAVRNSLAAAWQPNGNSTPTKQANARIWPEKNLKLIEEICKNGPGLVGLWEASSVRFEDSEPHTEEIIDRMFPGDPLLCCGTVKMPF
jgi:hypothetical protein